MTKSCNVCKFKPKSAKFYKWNALISSNPRLAGRNANRYRYIV